MPRDIGYDQSRIAQLDRHFAALTDAGEILGASYCISRFGQVFAQGAVGSRTYRKREGPPFAIDTVNNIASITKTFTAVAVMRLVEDGLTGLNVPVGEILPKFCMPPFNDVTLFQLLTHTSGLSGDDVCFPHIESEFQRHRPEAGEFDWIAAGLGACGGGLKAKPGTQWAYCSFGFLILGAVIERLTGMSSHTYIEAQILKPLGMGDSIFDLTPELAKRYVIPDAQTEKDIEDIIHGRLEPHPLWDRMPATSNGMNATPYDLIRFANMLLSGGELEGARILGRKSVEKMTTNAIGDIPGGAYGIGFDMRKGPLFLCSDGTFMHEGGGGCALVIDPVEGLAAAWFVPFAKEGRCSRALDNVMNIIWSGLK